MSERKPLFVECQNCGERWKWLTLPLAVTKMPRSARCPNCGEEERVGICPTEGPHAVTEPRDGTAVEL